MRPVPLARPGQMTHLYWCSIGAMSNKTSNPEPPGTPPEDVARAAKKLGCRSVAFNYHDPVIFLEYAVYIARACHAVGVATIAVTAGYIEPGPPAEFFTHMDAANIDLKEFNERF